MISAKPACLALLLVLGAHTAASQTYWSTDPNLDCSGYPHVHSKPAGVAAGAFACNKSGDLPWYAAGQGWRSYIRVSAPPSAPIWVHIFFIESGGALTLLNFAFSGDPAIYWDYSVSRVLAANQSTEIAILGSVAVGPFVARGRLPVDVYCPDAKTCSQVEVQLIYSALPFRPWSFSVPAVWDDQFSRQWSAVGIDDGRTDQVSFVVANHSAEFRLMQRAYTLNVYDSSGKLYSTGTTPGVDGGGCYGALLRDVVPDLPPGPFKVQLVADSLTAFEAFQFHGDSATALVTASEKAAAPATSNAANGAGRTALPARKQLALPPGDLGTKPGP